MSRGVSLAAAPLQALTSTRRVPRAASVACIVYANRGRAWSSRHNGAGAYWVSNCACALLRPSVLTTRVSITSVEHSDSFTGLPRAVARTSSSALTRGPAWEPASATSSYIRDTASDRKDIQDLQSYRPALALPLLACPGFRVNDASSQSQALLLPSITQNGRAASHRLRCPPLPTVALVLRATSAAPLWSAWPALHPLPLVQQKQHLVKPRVAQRPACRAARRVRMASGGGTRR